MKKNYWKVEQMFGKFYSKFGESLKLISRMFESKNFRIMKSRPSRNHRDQILKEF